MIFMVLFNSIKMDFLKKIVEFWLLQIFFEGFLKQMSLSNLLNRNFSEFIAKCQTNSNDFFKPTFLPKNERTNSTLLLVDLFSFVFWKKVKTPKRHFKIN